MHAPIHSCTHIFKTRFHTHMHTMSKKIVKIRKKRKCQVSEHMEARQAYQLPGAVAREHVCHKVSLSRAHVSRAIALPKGL